MSTTTASAPVADQKVASTSGGVKLPPEPKFWKRYSPHGEAPLSFAGSLTLHALGLGGAFLLAVYLVSLYKPTQSLPVDPVRLVISGGGGKPGGSGNNKGVGKGVEDVGTEKHDQDLAGLLDEGSKLPPLNPVQAKKVQETFDPDSARFIQMSKSDSAKRFAQLDDNIRKKLADGLQPGKGASGPGSGGGEGPGKGPGSGSGSDEGKSTLSKREKRMLRWHMLFTANNGAEYLAQLRGLGAILAIPTKEGPSPEYKIVRDLHPGRGKLLDEDLSKIQRIYWIDDKPRSVTDILNTLGIKMPTPSRFVAFMPEKLEAELFNMERRYVERVLKQPFDEDRIEETRFRVVATPRGYKPELIGVAMK